MTSKNLKRWFSLLQAPIEGIYQPWAVAASKRLSGLLQTQVQIDLIGIDTIHSVSDTEPSKANAPRSPWVDCSVGVPESTEPWILRVESGFVYLMIDNLLGASVSRPSDQDQQSPPKISSIDWRVASYGLEELVHLGLDLWHPDAPLSSPRAELRQIDKVKTSDSLRVHFQMRIATTADDGTCESLWHAQWWIPESYIASQFGRLLVNDPGPATLTVTLARSTIARAELAQLEVGDIISTEQLASHPATVECNSQILMFGNPGVYKGSKALLIQ